MTTWSPFGGGQGGRPDGTQPDILKDEGGLLISRGNVVYDSDFNSRGLDGWWHYTNGEQVTPIGLTTHPSNGGKSLKLQTKAGAFASGAPGNSAAAYKRMVSYRETGLASVSYWWSYATYEQAVSPAWEVIVFGVDTEKFDRSSRMFPKFAYRRNAGGSPRWTLTNDFSSSFTVVPDSANTVTGANENKMGINYTRITVDRDANDGVGGYFELQSNNHVFDLRSLGAGAGAQHPQEGTEDFDDFRGGFNPAVFVTRNSANPGAAAVVVHKVVVTMGDVQ